MTWRTPREPEPIEIELVPLEVGASPFDHRGGRPPPAGAGTLPGASELVLRVLARAGAAPAPRLGPDQHQLHPWPELRVHRLVRLPLPAAEQAFAVVVAERSQAAGVPVPCTHRTGPPIPVLSPLTRLHLGSIRRLGADQDGIRVDGSLRVHPHRRPTPIEVTVEPWSRTASDVSLQVRARRRPAHLPRRYFDVAHGVMDDLWHQVEAADCR